MGEKITVSGERHKIRISHILIFLLLIIVAPFAFFKYNTKRELNKRLEAIRAAGEPVTFAELNQFYSIPFDVENSAFIILDAAAYYKEPNDFTLLPIIGTGELPGRTKDMSEEIKEIISQYLAKNKKSLELLHTTAGLEYGRYPVDFNRGLATLHPYLAEIRKCALMLQLESILAVENKNPDMSFESFKSICSIANSLKGEPSSVSQYVRIAYQEMAIESLEYSMNKLSFTDKQLEEIENLFDEMVNSNGMQYGLFGERCMFLDSLLHPQPDYIRASTANPNKLFSSRPFCFLYQVIGLSDSDALIFLSIIEDALKSINLPIQDRYNAINALNEKIYNIPKKNVLLIMPNIGGSLKVFLRNITHLNTARAAIAVERFRSQKGVLPDSLSNLVPEYLESIPLDPYDGKQIRYKKLEKGFVVYSVGEDLIDDGGKEEPKQKDDSTWDITFIIEK